MKFILSIKAVWLSIKKEKKNPKPTPKNASHMAFGYFIEGLYNTVACGNGTPNLWLKDDFDTVLENQSTETTEYCFNLKNN